MHLRERQSFLQDEVNILRESVSAMEPKLARIEPELNALRSERDGWLKERSECDAELSKLRHYGRLLNEISTELHQLNDLSDAAHNSNSAVATSGGGGLGSSGSNYGASGGTPIKSTQDFTASISANASSSSGISLSQRHSLWVGLPSLRNLSVSLYENIRRMAQDLHAKELQCSDLLARLSHATTEMAQAARSNENQWQQLSRQQEGATQTIARLSEIVNTTEKELTALRSNRITVDQIRVVLASYPGDFTDLRVHELFNSSSGSGGSGGNSRGYSSNTGDMSFTYESKQSEARHHHHLPPAAHGHSHHSKETAEFVLSKVSFALS